MRLSVENAFICIYPAPGDNAANWCPQLHKALSCRQRASCWPIWLRVHSAWAWYTCKWMVSTWVNPHHCQLSNAGCWRGPTTSKQLSSRIDSIVWIELGSNYTQTSYSVLVFPHTETRWCCFCFHIGEISQFVELVENNVLLSVGPKATHWGFIALLQKTWNTCFCWPNFGTAAKI